VLRVLPRRSRLHNRAQQPARKAHAFTLDISAGILEQFQGAWKVPELDADFLEHGIGIVLDKLQALFIQNLEVGNLAFDKSCRRRWRCLSCRTSSLPACGSPSAWFFRHFMYLDCCREKG